MKKQDKSGAKYEEILAISLSKLGYICNAESGKNYIRPLKTDKKICIPDTYVQPDIVVRDGLDIKAVIYVTHWSKARNSAFKFWRTWEELAQQRSILGGKFLAINCIFEALPGDSEPKILFNSDELERDSSRDSQVPIGFHGWYPATTWALLESFDLSLVFPLGYEAVHLKKTIVNPHDLNTTNLLKNALSCESKPYFRTQWEVLQKVVKNHHIRAEKLYLTQSRYRIGLLHVYLAYRLWEKSIGSIDLLDFVNLLIQLDPKITPLSERTIEPLIKTNTSQVEFFLNLLSKIPVRMGRKPKFLLDIKITDEEQELAIDLNSDLRDCLRDLKAHTSEFGFLEAVLKSFNRFDKVVDNANEAIEDIADLNLVKRKESFVRSQFLDILGDTDELKEVLAKLSSPQERTVSKHRQNWILEMVFYLAGIDIAEDIYTKITAFFESNGHRLRPHAPFGGDTMLIRYLLQGRDICEHWSKKSGKRTLSEAEFYDLSWQALAQCIAINFSASVIVSATEGLAKIWGYSGI